MNTSRAQLNRALQAVLLANPRIQGDLRAQLIDALREAGQPGPDAATISTGLVRLHSPFGRVRIAAAKLAALVRDEHDHAPPRQLGLPRGISRVEYRGGDATSLRLFDQDLDASYFDEVFGYRRPDDDAMPVDAWVNLHDHQQSGLIYIGARAISSSPHPALTRLCINLHRETPDALGVGLDADLYMDGSARCLDVALPLSHNRSSD